MNRTFQDPHLVLLGEINGKVDMLVARAEKDEERLATAATGAWWGKGALLLVILSLYPKARDLIGPLFGL